MYLFNNHSRGLLLTVLLTLAAGSSQAQDRLYANEFPLGDVTLLNGPLKHARDLNIETLLKYDNDRLLAPYLKEAGLTPKGQSYPNWDGLDGHVGGHYLTAMAINAATGSQECRERMEYWISELQACADANAKNHPDWGRGYVGGVPGSDRIWSNFKKGNFGPYFGAWVPFYNIHKMYAGLRDAWVYCGNEQAKKLFLGFCDWAIDLTANLTDAQMERALDTEHGGMNEVLADAYAITGEQKYLDVARRFSHRRLLNPLMQRRDVLDNMHANTQVPKVIGFERIAELSGDEAYHTAGAYFWDIVTGERTLAFGGNSRREHFPSREACQDPRHYRNYSAPNEAMWCCVGTGMENHGKYNQFIYTHSGDALFVNLFVASELNWKAKGITLRQETSFPYSESSRITITQSSNTKQPTPIMVRYPGWVKPGQFCVKVNGKPVSIVTGPSSYVAINRQWKKGDVIDIQFPMYNSVKYLPNLPQYIALMHGPIMLAMKTGTEDLAHLIADDSRFGQLATGKKLPIDQAPILVNKDVESIANQLQPIAGKPLHFPLHFNLSTKMVNKIEGELMPFFELHDARYMMYWLALSEDSYKDYLANLTKQEQERQALEARTTDKVQPGEQQPESDHFMETDQSTVGNTNDVFFRDARDGHYFSYLMQTGGKTDLSLRLKYWGVGDWKNPEFDIFVDDALVTTVNLVGKYRTSQFKFEEYPIPAQLLKGKKQVRVKFVAKPHKQVGEIYEVRLISNNQ